MQSRYPIPRNLCRLVDIRKHRSHDSAPILVRHQQQSAPLLEQFAERLIDGDNGFVMEAPPLQDFALTHGAPVRGFSSRASSFRLSVIVLSYRLEDWKHNNSADVESLASIREFLVGKSESLAAAVAGYDVRFAKGLPLLWETATMSVSVYCAKHSRHQRLVSN
jgi:hypothetical protein